MKKIMMVLLAAALLAGCSGNSDKKTDAATDQEALAADWVEVTLNVDGMTCDGCEKAIKAGVETLDGIATVESSFEEGWTRVKYDGNKTTVEDIEGKITETGYTVKGEL
jgi:copper chaperone